MDADERAIYYYLKSRRPKAAPVRDIARHVGGRRRFRYAPDWARPVLLRMIERGIVETDATGSYRLSPVPKRVTEGKRWASPDIAEILKSSGKGFSNLLTDEDEDAYYENL
jgi:hypothetical protein